MDSRKKNEAYLKKPESWLWHLMGFIIPSLVIFGNLKGGIWVSGGLITALVIFPIIEKYIGEDKNKREVRKNGLPFEIILIVHALLMVPIIKL